MFFNVVLEHNMQLHPRYFGCNLRHNMISMLVKDVEGTCSGRDGFITKVTGIENNGKGSIRGGTGFVTFLVKISVCCLQPFNGKVLEAVITMVDRMGFFAEAGRIQIFVSNHLIPEDMEFQSGDIPKYSTSDGSFCIGTIKDEFFGSNKGPYSNLDQLPSLLYYFFHHGYYVWNEQM